MARQKTFRKTAQRPIRFTDDQLRRIEDAANRRAQEKGEMVTGSEIIREGAIKLADEILRAA